MPYNKIVTPLVQIRNETPTGSRQVTSNLQMVCSLLIKESATEIFIVPFNQNEKVQIQKEINNFSSSFKKKVKLGDADFKIKQSVDKFLQPTYDLSDSVWFTKNGKKLGPVPYTDPYLETAIRILKLASKEKAEADIPSYHTIKSRLEWSKRNCSNDEGKSRVDELTGLFNCYSELTINGLSINYNDPNLIHISDRLDNLLADPDMQELSQLRGDLGIREKLKLLSKIKPPIEQKIKKLLKNKLFISLLNHTPQIISLALTEGTFSIPALPFSEWKSYSPPLVNLSKHRMKLLKTIPNLNSYQFIIGDSHVPKEYEDDKDKQLTSNVPGTLEVMGMKFSVSSFRSKTKSRSNNENTKVQDDPNKTDRIET